MSKLIRRFLSLLLVLQLIIPYSTFAAAVGEFSSVVGNVTQTRAKEVITPIVKSPVEMKDLIVTARSASATMVFSDDSKIMLSENTKLEIKEFLFKEKSRTGIFSLAIGKVAANVKKYIGGDNVFEVHSPTAAVGVRGTGFEFIEAMKDGNVASNVGNQGMATVTCTEGSLNLSALAPTGEVISTAVLEAGQVAIIMGGMITISKIGAALAAGVASSSKAGTAGAAGGAGTGTGGAAAGGGATVAAGGASAGAATVATVGTATAATGMSTTAIAAGIAIGGAAVVGGAVAAGGGGGGSSSSSGSSTTPTPTPTPSGCSAAVGNWAGTVTGNYVCGQPFTGNWTMTVNSNCSGVINIAIDGSQETHPFTVVGNGFSGSESCTGCTGTPGTRNISFLFSGNTCTGNVTGCGEVDNFSGTRQ